MVVQIRMFESGRPRVYEANSESVPRPGDELCLNGLCRSARWPSNAAFRAKKVMWIFDSDSRGLVPCVDVELVTKPVIYESREVPTLVVSRDST